MSNNDYQFSEVAEEMHAGAADYEAMRELFGRVQYDAQDVAEAMAEARENDGVSAFLG
jgi:hypothetical protein